MQNVYKKPMKEILIANIAIFAGFFVQTTVGFAASLIAIPLLLFLFGFQDTIAYLSIFLLGFSLIMGPKSWKSVNKKAFLSMAITSVIGLFVGIQLLKIIQPQFLEKILGVFTLTYIIYHYFKKKRIKSIAKHEKLFGFLGGLSSGLINNGGIIFLIHLNSRFHLASHVRGTIIALLGISNILRIPLLIQNELLSMEIFAKTIWALPGFLLALLLGSLFYKKIDEAKLKQLMLILLAIMGLVLIFK